MDFARIEGYLRSACGVLDFDVGELWQAEKITGGGATLDFVQIYTSPLYDRSQRSLLLKPEMSSFGDQTKAEELHQISPVICRSVCDGGQIVWANSNVPEGLVENSRVRLATAVGMPICSIGGNLCVIVLFATQPIPMTPIAIEFLCAMARAASGIDNTSGFAKSPTSGHISPSHAKTDQFKGVWDIRERLNSSYSAAIDYHLLPIGRLQAFFDFQEVTSLNDIGGHPIKVGGHHHFGFVDQSLERWNADGSRGTDDLQWTCTSLQLPRPRSVSEAPLTTYKAIELTADALLMSSFQTDNKGIATKQNDLEAEGASPNASNSGCSTDMDEDEEILEGASLEFVFEDEGARNSSSPVCLPSPKGFQRAVQIDARTSFRLNQSRFHEFMDAILGLTLFDCVELWLLSEKTPELYIVSALHRDEAVQQWTSNTKGMRLQKGVDVPGMVYQTSRSHWDKHYSTRHLRRASRKVKRESPNHNVINLSPRSDLATQLGMSTAFGVPLPGPSGSISGVLALYSRAKVEPDSLLLSLVHKSAQLMSVCAAMRPVLSRNNSGRGESQFPPSRPSISENPYSFFCPADAAPSSSPNSTTFPFTDYSPYDSAPLADESGYPIDATSYRANGALGDTPCGKSLSIQIPGSSPLYRTVSANELAPNPHQMFHSHSMPDNMYLESSYIFTELQRSKRARSIDLRSTCDRSFSTESLPTYSATARNDISVPPVADLFNHPNLQWNTLGGQREAMKSFDLSAPLYPYNDSNSYPYLLPEILNVHHSLIQRENIPATSFKPVSQNAMPLSVLLPNSIQVPIKAQESNNGFNPDLTFNHEFVFEHNLTFESDCRSSDELPSQTVYPVCRVEGCETASSHRSPFCVVHAAGGRRCQQEGCNKCAQGSTCHCIAHGGGRRCTFPGCGKGARDKFFCAGHGGGKRCVSSDCTKSAVGGSKFCTGHGGGKRCKIDGCDKSAQSSTLHCVKHGGGRKCSVERCSKVARGKTDYCAAHGGGARCRTAHCNKAAVGRYQYCRPHYSAIHGSESASKMTEEEDDYIIDEEEELRCGECVSSPSVNAA